MLQVVPIAVFFPSQVASFGSLFVAPPVGLALGATSAAAGVSSTTGDAVADAELWQPRFKPFKLEDFVMIFLHQAREYADDKEGVAYGKSMFRFWMECEDKGRNLSKLMEVDVTEQTLGQYFCLFQVFL